MNRILTSNFEHNFDHNPDPSLEPQGETAASIELFRAAMYSLAMHSLTEREAARPINAEWLAPARRRQRSAQRRMVLAWACAAALCFAVVPFSIHAPHAQKNAALTASSVPPQTEESDTALLEQVDNAISEPVPSSLAPLTEMDSWNSTTSTSEASLHTTEKKNVVQ